MVGRVDNTEAANLSVAIRNALGVAPVVRPTDAAPSVAKPLSSSESSDKNRVQDDQQRQAASFAASVDPQAAKSLSFTALRDTIGRAFGFGQTTAGGRGLLGALTAFAARLFGQEQDSNPTPTDVAETIATANAAYDQAMTLDPYSYTNGQMVFSSLRGDGRPLASGRILDLTV